MAIGGFAVFPELQGLGWNVVRRPKGSTSIEEHTSGRSTRVGYWANPLYEWELTYELLRDFPWLPGINSEMRRLQGFYNQMQGKHIGFLFSDPSDNQVTNQFIGTGDGTSILFPLGSSFGDPGAGAVVNQPVGAIDTSSGFAVYLNGIPQAADTIGYVVGTHGEQQLGFTAAPPAGVVITANYNFLFYVHFKDDNVDFNKFAGPDSAGYWGAKKIVLESLRPEAAP